MQVPAAEAEKREVSRDRDRDREKSIDNDGASELLRQQQIMREQDEQLDSLMASVSRMKSIAVDISAELDAQQSLLDDLDSRVDTSSALYSTLFFFHSCLSQKLMTFSWPSIQQRPRSR
jgi:hypothetical protein